jgi:RimJ/RimL family protein N-acetyltransferase
MAGEEHEIVAGGEGIFLRPLRDEDIDDRYVSWFRDPRVTQYLKAKNISRQDALDFLHYGQETKLRFQYAICAQDTGLHIGNVKIGDIERNTMISELAMFIGDRDYWRRGFATAAHRLAIKIAFESLGIRKLHAGQHRGNDGALKACLRSGWKIEAILHQHVLGPDGYCDLVLLSCFNPAYFTTLPTFPLPIS